MQNLRIKAAQTLQSILEDKVFFGELKKQFSEKDLPFANMLILTALRRYVALHAVLHSFLSKKIPHKHRFAEYLLILAECEILYMQTAPYAVINETVANTRKTTDRFLGGLANAVLRKISAQKEVLLKKIETINPLPESFLQILDGYSDAEIKQTAQSLNILPPLDITVKENPAEWAAKIKAELLPNGSLRLYNNPKVPLLTGYNDGLWWVQDAAASLPVQTLPKDLHGLKALDLCAAPGGKTAQLAVKGAEVTAIDISPERLDTLKQNMKRLGIANVTTIAADALEFLQDNTEQFDIILLDAPCSATGTFRRHPEVLYIKTQDDVAQQAALQKQLLCSCKSALKVGGTLVYSTCSIAKAEGEKQIFGFLQEHKEFEIYPIEKQCISAYGEWQNKLITSEGFIRTLPFYESGKNGIDSFFICKLKRII